MAYVAEKSEGVFCEGFMALVVGEIQTDVVKCKPEKMNADLAHQLDELRINLENVLNN